jgi:hypothetical protein
MSFYLLMSLYKMSKCYKRQGLNPLSILFYHGIIRIFLVSHLSQVGDTWESFLSQNNFSQPECTMNSPINVNPISDNPVTESQGFDSHNDCEIIEPIYVPMQTPIGKKPRCVFFPRKSLEQVVDVLKERIYPTHAIESNQGFSDKPTVKKNRNSKKQESLDSNFINKRSGRLISRSLRNQKHDHLSLIYMIEVNDHCSDDEINDFLTLENLDNQCLRNETIGQYEKYDFVSRLPMFLKGQNHFLSIGQDLKKATRKHKILVVEYIPPRPAITHVHCDSCLDWVVKNQTSI